MPGGGSAKKTAAEIAAERAAKLQGPRQLEQVQQGSGSTVLGNLTQFRPPPGFLDATLRGEDAPRQLDASDTGAMLSQLKAEAGNWPDLARMLPALNRAGLDGPAIEEATGLERVRQNMWMVAVSVYDSLKQMEVEPDVIDYFTQEGGDELLYELRFLAAENRPNPATYIAEKQLDQRMALTLARSIKEHERRAGETLGFSLDSGDCLAFKYYRDALECKKERDIEDCIRRGLDCATSDSARTRLRTVLDAPAEKKAATKEAGGATLEMVRFTREELGVRPVALAGTYGEVTAEAFSSAPSTTTSGPFSSFRLEAPSVTEWVALPAWNIILLARAPVAVFVPDASQIPQVVRAANIKEDKDLARLKGPALLICDRSAEVDDKKYHLTAEGSGALQLTSAKQLAEGEHTVIGRVLFCCRPPSMLLGPSADTSQLLQL